jgi:hypothetical protein
VLYGYKNKVDKKNKVTVIHFNPIFAAESKDVRSMSNLASAVGVREIAGLNESMFLAVAKHKPMLAMAKFFNHLAQLQCKRAKELLPEKVKKMISAKEIKFIEA